MLGNSARIFVGFVGICSLLFACGGSETASGAEGDASVSPTGGDGGSVSGTGGTSASGGAGGTGGSEGLGGDRPAGTGGAAGSTTTDAAGDKSFCWDDGGRLVTTARACQEDGDCAILFAPSCCGADSAVGVVKSEQTAFASCFGLPPNACQGLGCAKFVGYVTDTGKMTPYDATVQNPRDLVTVHCVAKLCTTDVVSLDGGHD
jgi:hypothetical protein